MCSLFIFLLFWLLSLVERVGDYLRGNHTTDISIYTVFSVEVVTRLVAIVWKTACLLNCGSMWLCLFLHHIFSELNMPCQCLVVEFMLRNSLYRRLINADLANPDIGALWQITRGGKFSAEDSPHSRTFAGLCCFKASSCHANKSYF